MKKSHLAALSLALAVSAHAQSQDTKPTWELGKNPIDPASIHGKVELVDGVVKLDCSNSFAIPASVLGEQNDYTIEFELRRSPNFKTLPRMEGALLLVSNRDAAAHAGLSLIYFPPAWDSNTNFGNQIGIEVNTYWNGTCGGLEGEAFNKYSIVVKDRQISIYRNGLLLAMTSEIKPSQMPLTIGGKGWGSGEPVPNQGQVKPVPEPYELRNLKIYDQALSPTGFDHSTKLMRNASGEGYNMQRAVISDPTLPRILVVGDSISMGYRGFITEHFKGRAYVDYWVGGGWFNWTVKEEDFPALRSWDGVLSNGPYDVVSWNSMTLHMWTPENTTRCLAENYPGQMTRVVEHLRQIAPKTSIIWVRSTFCYTTPVEGQPSVIDEKRSERHVMFNKMTDEIMAKYGIPEVDLWEIGAKNLDKTAGRTWSKDTVHWNSEAYRLMADAIIKEIEKSLPQKSRQGGK